MDAYVPQAPARGAVTHGSAASGRDLLNVAPPLEKTLSETEEVVIVTHGRKSGRAHETTVWCAYEDGVIWLRTDHDSDWYRNLKRDPRCRIRVGDTEAAAVSAPIPDEADALRHVVEL